MLNSTLTVILICSILCLIEVHAERSACDEAHEFWCPVDDKCIPKRKVCNFVEDCVGGADELHCGACDFSIQTPEECGLNLKSDRAFAWFRKEPLREDYMKPKFHDEHEPLYYVQINLNETMKQYSHRNRNRFNHIYKPKIIFPHLRPTNNDKCRALIRMRITEMGAQVFEDELEDSTWPQVSLLIVEPREHVSSSEGLIGGRENRKYTSLDLEVKKKSAAKRGYWINYKVPLGLHHTVWTIELIVEARIRSSLVQLGGIKYLDCEPFVVENSFDEAQTDVPLENVCDASQFRCEFSGLCIDKSFLCDFGHDCGDNDTSDEAYCDDYLGRCDFEDGSLCDWSIAVNGSWYQVSASDEDQAFYDSKLARPLTDHTYQSQALGGHYLLLNSSQLKMFTMYNLMGPHIRLQPGASECNFRFWLSTPGELNGSISSPHMNVGRVHLPAERLFVGDKNSLTWRRHEIHLLSRSNIEESNIFVLQVGFGNFGADLATYLESGGYVALDDFSFTPGCHLVYHGPALEDSCGDNRFFCHVPTSPTGAHCIPLKNYCDFKNDCGLDGSLVLRAEDELDCPHECRFRKDEHCLGLKVQDGLSKRLSGEYKMGDHVNEAFDWSMVLNETSGQLLVKSRSDKFLTIQMAEMSLSNSSQALRNLEIHLPTFSEAHANCSLELAYKWANNTAESVQASIYLANDKQSIWPLIRRLTPNDLSRSSAQTTKIGIGHQSNPFKVLINVHYKDNLAGGIPHQGSFSIYSYQFIGCAFQSGFLEAENEIKFESLEEDTDDDDMEAMDYLDYQYGAALNSSCETGYFQCHNPILCLPMGLVCDMQRDCQGGADEQGCTTPDHWVQFDFDQLTEEDSLAKSGWVIDGDGQSEKMIWSPTEGARSSSYRSSYRTGPAYDHTRSDYSGKYLVAGAASDTGHPQDITASLHSPHFIAGPQCERVVFYLYFWGEHLNKFQVLKYSNREEILLYELKGDAPQQDQWQRVSLSLIEENSTTSGQFNLIFRAFSGDGPSDLMALDDVSFGPLCNPSPNQREEEKAVTSTVDSSQWESAANDDAPIPWTKVTIVLALMALLVMVSVSCHDRSMLNLVPSAGGGNMDTVNGSYLTASGYMMEVSLEDLGDENNYCNNQSDDDDDESQSHQV